MSCGALYLQCDKGGNTLLSNLRAYPELLNVGCDHGIIKKKKKSVVCAKNARFGPIIIIGKLIQRRHTVKCETKRDDQSSGSSNCHVFSTYSV